MSQTHLSQHALIISLHRISQLIFIMGTDCVLCEARTGFRNITDTTFSHDNFYLIFFISPIKFHIIPFAVCLYTLPFSDFAVSPTSATISDSNIKLELCAKRTFYFKQRIHGAGITFKFAVV